MSILFPTRDELAADWDNTRMTILDIAKKYGRSKSLVGEWAKRFQFPKRDGGRKRIANKADRVKEFRRLWDDPSISLSSISRHFGVCNKTLARWAEIERFPPRTFALAGRLPPCRRIQQEHGRLPGDPTPEEIAERAAECRARRGLGFVFADE
jgi:transposase-like protein